MTSYIKIYLEYTGQTHCGYCSDPADIKDFNCKYNEYLFDFPNKEFIKKTQYINLDDAIPTETYLLEIIEYISNKYNEINISCDTGGSNYCGCSGEKKVTKIKIIYNNENNIKNN